MNDRQSRPLTRPRIVVLDGATLAPGDNPWDEVAALGDLAVHDRTPEALGWPRDLYVEAVEHAAELRNRYTFLDLARDSRDLDAATLL